MRTRITLITPTIGRPPLKRCVESVLSQISHIHRHFIIGDGPQESWVKSFCESKGAIYHELPSKLGGFGYGCRNYALDYIENHSDILSDYIVFLDDDNELLMNYTYNVDETARENNDPPIMYQPILYTGKFNTFYRVLPETGDIPANGEWDTLSGIFRTDIIRGLRFQMNYNQDWMFALAAKEKTGKPFVKVKGVNAIHHVSWDTYAESVKG